MLEQGDIAKIVLVNKETAEIFIKPESLSKEMHKDVEGKGSSFGGNNYQYYYNVGSVDKFYTDVEEAQKDFQTLFM